MATARLQRRWRDRQRSIKTQLNVMARREIHDGLAEIATRFEPGGKGEAVAFCCVLTRALLERAAGDDDIRQMIADLADGYHKSREIHAA
jgi:hypothetical protein